MSGQTLAEVLAEAFDEWLFRMHGTTSSCDHLPEGEGLAAAVLASDWLAERDARVRAEERERIAQAIEAKYLGADFGRQYDGRESPDAALHNAYDEGLQTAAEVARGGVAAT